MSHTNYENNDNNKNNTRIGNSNRNVEFEIHEIRGVFPNANPEDFFILDNGNKGIRLVFLTNGNNHNDEFEVLIEFLYDYPNSPPSVHVIRPNIEGVPHTLYNKQMCYVNTSSDWNASFTCYDIIIMIQTWIYAYCKWQSNGIWDWYQDNEFIPSPPPKSEFNNTSNKRERNQTPTYYKDPLSNYYSAESQSDNNNLGYSQAQVEENIDNNFEINQVNNIDNNNNSNSEYGRVPVDDNIDNKNNNSNSEYGRVPVDDNIDKPESPNTVGRIIFATIFSLMFIAYNHWTTLVVLPFFALLFISSKSRTVGFIVLSLIIIITSNWSFVIVPLFGLLYTSKKRYQITISVAVILFWMAMAIIGNNIVDIKIFG